LADTIPPPKRVLAVAPLPPPILITEETLPIILELLPFPIIVDGANPPEYAAIPPPPTVIATFVPGIIPTLDSKNPPAPPPPPTPPPPPPATTR
jgi:WAS/WASL-interacting protein